jgi:hypothetical protein
MEVDELEAEREMLARLNSNCCRNRPIQNPTDELSDETLENNRVEYAVLLPNSFTILDSTFDDQNSLLL